MKSLSVVNNSFKDLYQILIDSVRSNLFLTGIELKVFNHLIKPMSAIDVAQAIDAHPENTRLFLDALAASKLLVKKNGMYWNTPLAQDFLVENSPTFMGEFLSNHAQFICQDFKSLYSLVKEGPQTVSDKFKWEIEETWAKQAVMIAKYQKAGVAQEMAKIISELPEFPSFQKMLDLGGGPGLIGMSIVAAHPTMKGVIFDQPEVVKVSKSFMKEYEMDDRMGFMGGDYLNDPIGEKYDLVLASATLNFAKDDIDLMMTKIYDALNPGGLCVVFTDGLTHERTTPESMVLGWLSTAMMGRDMGLEQGFIADSMLRVGFKSVRSTTQDWPMGPMDMEVARK